MATVKSTLYSQQQLGAAQLPTPAGFKGLVYSMSASIAVGTGLATNDLLDFFTLPKGATLLDARLWSTDLDTNVSPAITLDLGDADGAATIFSASTVAQAGGVDSVMVQAARNKQYVVDTLIQGKVHLQAGTAAAGTVGVTVLFTLDGLAAS